METKNSQQTKKICGRPFPKGHKINVGRPCSLETREKIRKAQKGKSRKKHTKEWKLWFSKWLKENHPNRKEKIKKICLICKKVFFVQPCFKNRKYCSLNCCKKRGLKILFYCKNCDKKFISLKCNKKSDNVFCSKSCANSFNSLGSKSHFWKGGITKLQDRIRTCFEYRQWRNDVFTRDNYICQECGDDKGGNLEAHHLKAFALILKENNIITIEQALECEELWNLNNGQTLCIECHKLTDNYSKNALKILNRP